MRSVQTKVCGHSSVYPRLHLYTSALKEKEWMGTDSAIIIVHLYLYVLLMGNINREGFSDSLMNSSVQPQIYTGEEKNRPTRLSEREERLEDLNF